ncbi:MAG TPA: flagellar export chaperone FlgN [Verrucomicrobiae bacterium]|nr:flagellar export chaperone FlgN [Verrucomicrobiae bacterium]
MINRIIECLRKQKDCYVQLLAIARRQQKAIDEQNDPNLMKALQEKNTLLQALQALDEEMQPILINLSNSDRTLMIQKGQALKDEAAQTLEQLIAIEDACAKILRNKKEETAEQMKVFQERKKGLKGYGESGGKSSRFFQEG